MDLISVDEAAQILGVSGRRVRTLIVEGRLEAARVGRRTYVIDRAAAERLAVVPRHPGRPRRSTGGIHGGS